MTILLKFHPFLTWITLWWPFSWPLWGYQIITSILKYSVSNGCLAFVCITSLNNWFWILAWWARIWKYSGSKLNSKLRNEHIHDVSKNLLTQKIRTWLDFFPQNLFMLKCRHIFPLKHMYAYKCIQFLTNFIYQRQTVYNAKSGMICWLWFMESQVKTFTMAFRVHFKQAPCLTKWGGRKILDEFIFFPPDRQTTCIIYTLMQTYHIWSGVGREMDRMTKGF